jgi:hypothetical protein
MTSIPEWRRAQDAAKNPPYYTKGIEPWNYIASHKLGYMEGNVIKYVTRWQHKNGLEDLYKAREYLNKLIEDTESRTLLTSTEIIADD